MMTISKTLLTLTARGNAIITELNRLYELVPAVFLAAEQPQAANAAVEQFLDRDKRFTIHDLICDFSYFKIQESFEEKIDSNDELKRADEEFCNNYIDILTRFYLTFESVQRYSSDLNSFVQEIEDDVHVGQSFDSLLADMENRQLLCESYFLLGHMLLTIDNYFESCLRERIIVSYYRYSSYKSSPSYNLDETCNLMRSTGFMRAATQRRVSNKSAQHHRPEGYPESFFARVGVNSSLVSLLVSKLLSVDIYNQTVLAYPHPDHRSTALATQASMLYVILFFCPNILQTQRSKMREITDKFFYDNWVTSIYMGDLVNLIEAWNPYKAARESLVQLLELESTRALAEQYRSRFERASRQLSDYLKEGWLDEERVLEHHARILTLIRESNVISRWFLLHAHSKPDWNLKLSKSVRNLVLAIKPSDEQLYLFVQNLAEIERKFLGLYENLLKQQVSMMSESRSRAIETLDELVAIFSDPKPMRYIQPGAHTKLASRLSELVVSLKELAELKREAIIAAINQLTQLQDQYSDGKNLQVVQLFKETRDSLLQAMRSLSLSPDIRIILQSIGDFSYAWKIFAELFTQQMQQLIKDNPLRLHGIGATFLKLASAFDASLIRIQQVDSKLDLISVSKYYSSKLMSHIRDVLHVIPATILELLGSVIEIQTECVIGDLPSKISLDKLRDYALAEKRFQMLELTYKVSHYAESLMLMQNTVIGVIKVDSRKLLEDGIRRELVRRMSDSIRETLAPNSKTVKADSATAAATTNSVQLATSLLARLARLDEKMAGFRRSLEYVQDYLFIYGLKMWQEELSRIMRFNVDTATRALLGKSYLQQHRAADNQSSSQADNQSRISVPVYDSDPLKSSFVVLILDELLQITDPCYTVYDEQMNAWYAQRTKDRVLDLKVFELIGSSLGIVGLNGLDELCSCLLMLELQRLDELLISIGGGGDCNQVESSVAQNSSSDLLDALGAIAKWRNESNSATLGNQQQQRQQQQQAKTYAHALRLMAPHGERLANHLTSIGQLQLMRMSIASVLSTRSRCEARNLYNCLDTLNSSLLATLKRSAATPANASSQHKSPIIGGGGSTAAAALEAKQVGAAKQEAARTMISSASDDDDDDDNDDDEDEDICCQQLASISVVGSDDDHDHDAPLGLDLDESQLIFELTNHLEWLGLSEPLGKIYTLSLQSARSSQIYDFRQKLTAIDLVFLLLLDHCSGKFLFSKSISGFLPKAARSSFYQVAIGGAAAAAIGGQQHSPATDGGPLFHGLITLLNHYQPFLVAVDRTSSSMNCLRPLDRLLDHMAAYVRCSLYDLSGPHDLRLDSANMVLSMIELIRLARLPVGETLARTRLPQFVYDTFQFALCQLDAASRPDQQQQQQQHS